MSVVTSAATQLFYNTTRHLFWIGLSDASDGAVLEGYNNCATGQPSTISGGGNNALTNCQVYNSSGWLLSYCVTSLHNYLCEADGEVCMTDTSYLVWNCYIDLYSFIFGLYIKSSLATLD